MTNAEIVAVIAEAVREETDEDVEVGPETTADQVPGWDSLAHVRIVLNASVRLGVKVDITDTYTAANVGELARVMGKSLAAGGSP